MMNELECLEKREDIRLAQIVKKNWLKEGNQNTKYFHVVIKQKQDNLVIEKMKLDDGALLESPEQIHEGVVSYFQTFLSDYYERSP